MKRSTILLAVGMFAGGVAMAAAPATPGVTTSSGAIKRLDFDWEIIPRSNYYELWFQANQAAPYVKFSESVPWRPAAGAIFGGELALGDNGRTLTISQVSDRSGANGVDGDRNSTSKGASGAVWMY
jgi:hypothetical protein